jgi:YD repeat-containing protein
MRRTKWIICSTLLLIVATVGNTAHARGKELLAARQLSAHPQVHILRSGLAALMQGPTSGPVSYVYDELGRLIGAIDASGSAAVYNYDAVGNILSITRYASTQASLFSFSPKQGPVGASVTVYGTGFSATPSQNTVQFNGVGATVVSASTTQLVVTVPSGATSGVISVTSPTGSATSANSFTITSSSGTPRIDSFTPQIATSGTVVTVAGANFDLTPQNDRARVNMSSTAMPANVSPSSFQVTVPTQTSSGHIALDTPAGIATSSADLYIPPSGYSASQVTFTARANFGSTTTVSIGTSNTIGLLIFDGVAGHSVSLSTSSPAWNGSCTLQVFKPDYTALASSGSCSTANFFDSQKLPLTGTYTAVITPSTGVTGSVAVTIQDSTDFVTSIIPNGPSVTLNITSAGQNGRATFSATAGQQATVQFSSNTLGSVTASLLNPDGTTLTSLTSSSTSFSFPTIMLPSNGQYTIFVDPPSTNTGSIAVAVTLAGGSRAVPAHASGSVLDSSNTLTQNLVGLFVMNEGAGTTDRNLVDNQAADFSGTTVPVWNGFDPSVEFQGGPSLNSYLDAGTDLAFDHLTRSKMTVVAKVFLNSLTTGGIVEKLNVSPGSGFSFATDSTGALIANVVKTLDMRVATAAKTVASGQWMQLAFTWDGTVNTASAAHIYVNSIEQTKVTAVDGGPIGSDAGATSASLRVGNASYDSTMAGSFNGKIAYIAVYRGRILTMTELTQLDTQLPIDSLDVSGTVTPNGSSVPVTISSAGQNGRFFFTATGGQNATAQITNNTLGSVTVSVLNIDGTTLTTITSSASSFNVPPTLIPVTGTYPVYIHPNGAASGSLNLGVTLTMLPSRPTGSVLDSSNSLATSLVGLFVMNEASGTVDKNLVDNQSANFSGASAPTWNTSDPSIVFNGGAAQNSYVDAGADLAFDQLPTSQVTIVTKVYVSTLAAAGICEKNDVNQLAGFLFGWDSTGAISLEVEHSQTNMKVTTGNSGITAGQWIQVAFTWDGTVDTTAAAHIFVNGIEQTKVSSTSPGGTLTYANATNKPFRIGTAGFHSIAGSLNGKMAYLAVYRGRILTTSEMVQLDAQLPVH